MKRMMLFIGAVFAVVATQAASVNWSASGLKDYSGSTFYLFDASKQSEVLAALAAVDGDTATKLSEWAIMQGTVTSKGKATAINTNVGSTESVMALVINGTSLADGVTYIYIVDNISSMTYEPPSSAPGTLNSTLATTGTVGKMSATGGGDVPEPTSGFLLLVGCAILALRRKQE